MEGKVGKVVSELFEQSKYCKLGGNEEIEVRPALEQYNMIKLGGNFGNVTSGLFEQLI